MEGIGQGQIIYVRIKLVDGFTERESIKKEYSTIVNIHAILLSQASCAKVERIGSRNFLE